MKTVRRLAPVWLLLTFAFSVAIHGAGFEKPISLQIKSLARWKNSHESLAVQQGIGAMLKPRRDYPRFKEPFENAKEYAALFKRPFLILEAEPNDFGGFFALVVFRNHPKVLRFWLYEIDKNVFEIREVAPLRVTLNEKIMKELEDKRLSLFWLTSLPQ